MRGCALPVPVVARGARYQNQHRSSPGTETNFAPHPNQPAEQAHALPMQPPYDFVLAADCIYHETLTEHVHKTVMEVTNEKSTGTSVMVKMMHGWVEARAPVGRWLQRTSL